MATCPNCGVRSREDPGAFVVTEQLILKPLGTFSLAGQSLKASAFRGFRLTCTRCMWSIDGTIDGGDFVGIPGTEHISPPDTPE